MMGKSSDLGHVRELVDGANQDDSVLNPPRRMAVKSSRGGSVTTTKWAFYVNKGGNAGILSSLSGRGAFLIFMQEVFL